MRLDYLSIIEGCNFGLQFSNIAFLAQSISRMLPSPLHPKRAESSSST